LYGILPTVFLKLLTENSVKVVRPILADFFNNLDKIANFEKSFLVKQCANQQIFIEDINKKIQTLEKLLRDKNDEVEQLGEFNKNKENEIQRVSNIIKEKEGVLNEFQRSKEEQDNKILKLEGVIKEKERVLDDFQKAKEEQSRKIQNLEKVLNEKDDELNRVLKLTQAKEKCIQNMEGVINSKQTQLDRQQMIIQFTKREAVRLKNDINRMITLDKKIKILIIKPQQISVEDTKKVVHMIKNKYSYSTICLLANLLEDDYKILSEMKDIDVRYFCQLGKRSFSILEKVSLISIFWITRFDISVVLCRRRSYYKGYTKANFLNYLSGAKNRYIYYTG